MKNLTASCAFVLCCAAFLGALLPIYNLYILQPDIIESLNKETQHDAIFLAESFSTLLLKNPSKVFLEGLSPAESTTLVELKEQQRLFKVMLFAPDGTITFSTSREEIGMTSNKPYFFDIVAKGYPYRKLVRKQQLSPEGKVFPVDVVATYIPYMVEGTFVGAFEIYLDITARKSHLEAVILRSTFILMSISVAYLLIHIFIAIGAKRAIAKKNAVELKVEKLAYFDSLTGLPNRSHCYQHLTKTLATASRQQKMVAVLFLNLDHFKKVNDLWGHHQGDLLMKKVAWRLQSCLLPKDIVSRIGGDEFMVVLPMVETREEVATVAKILIKHLRLPFTVLGNQVNLTTSIGAVLSLEHGQDVDTLHMHSDIAMQAAKEDGGNCYRFFTLEMKKEKQNRHELLGRLNLALSGNEFYLVYQPQVDLSSGLIVGVEALLRWRHPERGLIPPDQFIPLAEESGLINEIGDWVLRTACIQLKIWQDVGLSTLRMAVNISGHQIKQDSFSEKVADILTRTQIDPSLLELEVTESIFMENVKTNSKVLSDLKALGISLALDDFGTGYSSLRYLHDFPFDRLKIDRSFVCDITTDEKNAAIVETIIAMSETLDLHVIAEGIENEEQWKTLHMLGCNEGQGYLFLPPMEAGNLRDILISNRDRMSLVGCVNQ